LLQEFLDWLGVLIKLDHIVHDSADLVPIECLEIADEVAFLRQFNFRLLVQATMDGIIGTLKQTVLAVDGEFVAVLFLDGEANIAETFRL